MIFSLSDAARVDLAPRRLYRILWPKATEI
nr:MAG TPA: hypothetical protein [Caudoviricetes sp.]